jgi:hypothetical protein
MAKEICISSTPHETRLAILEDDQLAEIYYERENEYTLAGSIYNGRVTRVLPGMQSAFVDVGLERDAFLYVTDFLELEDPEEADELEKAAATGGNQAPREVRHANGAGRGDDNGHRSTPKQDQKPDQKQDRQPRGRMIVEPASETAAPAPLESPFASSQPEGGKMTPATQAPSAGVAAVAVAVAAALPARRKANPAPKNPLRIQRKPRNLHRRRRYTPAQFPARGLPSQSWSGPSQTSAPPSAPSSRGSQAPVPFVLPGESLRKYGGTAEDESPKSAPAAPVRPASSFKPATLVDAPLSWDGSGLLPGESISRHRGRQPEPEVESAAKGFFRAEPDFRRCCRSRRHRRAGFLRRAHRNPIRRVRIDDAGLRRVRLAPRRSPLPPASASSAWARRRPRNPPQPRPPCAQARRVATVSAYAPGAGLIEEEVIEEEEFDAPHHHHSKTDEHDLEDYEEETLPAQMRTGDLGEMLQEAHLDHKIQLNFDDKNVEDESFDDEDDEEDEAAPMASPPPDRVRTHRSSAAIAEAADAAAAVAPGRTARADRASAAA